MAVNILVILIISVIQHQAYADDNDIEIFCSINGRKATNYVSEKFLSFSIDPAVLLAGVNLSETSLKLAQHLSPAYIRLAGPSTEFVRYVDADYKSSNKNPDDSNFVIITPSMWFGINEWLKLAGLTPVFGINDRDNSQGQWDLKNLLPLLEISNKLNISCLWQLGYDSSNKTRIRYTQDLKTFHEILKERNELWNIVGSDISHLRDSMGSILEDLKNTTKSVMWEPSTFEPFPEKDKFYTSTKRTVKIWTAVPKSSEPTTFLSALQWAKQAGEAAKFGFDVIFRQPRTYEIFSDSPVYWFSVLYKQLMGNNVLETRTTSQYHNSMIFAHCTRKQNSFARRGALTIMVVNDMEENYTVKINFGLPFTDKTMEVQSYILTSSALNSTEILLNGRLLTFKMLDRKNPFQPKLRRAKSSAHIPLSIPGYSIGFFVLPGARIPVCIDQEKEPELLLQELEDDQNEPLSQELAFHIESKFSSSGNNALRDITRKIKDELRLDKQYYNSVLETGIADLKQRLKGNIHKDEDVLPSTRQLFIERAKLLGNKLKYVKPEKKMNELEKTILQRIKNKPQTSYKIQTKDIELTSGELDKILKNRAQARAAQKNIVFTEGELQELVQKARDFFSRPRPRRDVKMNLMLKMRKALIDKNVLRTRRDLHLDIPYLTSILKDVKQKVEDKKNDLVDNINTIKDNLREKFRNAEYNYRFKRDINKDLLKIKVEGKKPYVTKNDYSKLFQKVDDDDDDDDFEENTSTLDVTTKPSISNIFSKKSKTLIVNPFYKKSEKTKSIIKPEELQLSTISAELKNNEDDFPCIHELFSDRILDTLDKKLKSNSKLEDELLEDKSKRSTLKTSKRIEESPEDDFDFRCKRDLKDGKRFHDINSIDEFRFSSVKLSKQPHLNDHDSFNELAQPLTENRLTTEHLRTKRDNKNKLENMQENINDLIQTIKSRSKLKNAEKTNNFKFPTIHKKPTGIGNTPEDFIMKTRNSIDTKYTDVVNNLKALKLKIDEHKNALDAKLRLNKYKAGLPIKEKSIKEIKPINLKSRIATLSPRLNELLNPSQILSASPIQAINSNQTGNEKNGKFHENNGRNNTSTNVSQTKVKKRSITNIEKKSHILGEYVPISSMLKKWKPSDILSLNKNFGVLRTNKTKPPNDYYILRRFSRQHRNSIRKRSITNGVNSYENEIDSDFNVVKKKSKVKSKIPNYIDNFLWKKKINREGIKNKSILETTTKNEIISTKNNTKAPLEAILKQEQIMLQSFIEKLFIILSKMGQHLGESLKFIKLG